METLHNIYFTLCKQGYCSDKGTVHSYLDVYADILEPYRHSALNVLEIGLFHGHSLRMWEQYFKATVWGIDCDEQPHGGMADLRPMILSGQHNIKIFDATDANVARKYFGDIQFDVIIEDASHQLEQQVELYKLYSQYLSPGGIYIIEDIDDIDTTRNTFETLDNTKNISILDRRNIKGRYDDVLCIIR